jgi:hypothetical protein
MTTKQTQPTSPIPDPHIERIAALAESVETSVAAIIAADVFEALLRSAPYPAWPAQIAAGLERLIAIHPDPPALIAAILRHLADLIPIHQDP